MTANLDKLAAKVPEVARYVNTESGREHGRVVWSSDWQALQKCHHALTAVAEYVARREDDHRLAASIWTDQKDAMARELQQAEAERDALKCCGNCKHYNVFSGLGWHGNPAYEGDSFAASHGDACHYPESRWERRP